MVEVVGKEQGSNQQSVPTKPSAPPSAWGDNNINVSSHRRRYGQSSSQHQQKAVPRGSSTGSGGKSSRVNQHTIQDGPQQQQQPQRSSMRSLGSYLIGKTMGQGTFGQVKYGINCLTGEKVAIKILEKNRVIEAADMRRVRREINILKKNRHPSLIQLYEVIDTPSAIYLIMEYADGGEMFDYIVNNRRLSESEACAFFHQIVDGIDYLHQVGVCHRDLKPENLLLQSSGNGGYLIKIIDFGLSNSFEPGELLATACGSPSYAPPEMIKGHEYSGPKADVWSMGVILFAMVCGYLPFDDINTSRLYKKIMAGRFEIPDVLSQEFHDLITKVLNTNPESRYSIADIRQHPWYNHIQVEPTKPSSSIITSTTGGIKEEEIDHDVLREVTKLGFKKDVVISYLTQGIYKSATGTYHILLSKKRREEEEQEHQAKQGNSKTLAAEIDSVQTTDTPLQQKKKQQQIPKLPLQEVQLQHDDDSTAPPVSSIPSYQRETISSSSGLSSSRTSCQKLGSFHLHQQTEFTPRSGKQQEPVVGLQQTQSARLRRRSLDVPQRIMSSLRRARQSRQSWPYGAWSSTQQQPNTPEQSQSCEVDSLKEQEEGQCIEASEPLTEIVVQQKGEEEGEEQQKNIGEMGDDMVIVDLAHVMDGALSVNDGDDDTHTHQPLPPPELVASASDGSDSGVVLISSMMPQSCHRTKPHKDAERSSVYMSKVAQRRDLEKLGLTVNR